MYRVNKLKNSPTQVSAGLAGCLIQMMHNPTDLAGPANHSDDVEVDEFAAYTKIWPRKINRGGLLHVTKIFTGVTSEVRFVSFLTH